MAAAAPELTARERQVAALVHAQRSNDQIARELRVSLGTVKSYLIAIRQKLGVETRVGVALWWERQAR